MLTRRRKDAIRKFTVQTVKNLVGAALVILLIWVGLKLAKVPMPAIRSHEPRMLDMDEPR